MKKAAHIYLVFILLNLLPENAFCQKVAEESFLGVAKSYLEYSVKYRNLDSNTVFIATGGNNKQSTFFYKKGSPFFRITLRYNYDMLNYKYNKVYKLGNYKLIITEGSNLDTTVLNEIFELNLYENLNKAENDSVRSEDFHWWSISFDNKYQVIYLDCDKVSEVIKLLKKNKVRFAKKFWFMDSNGRPKSCG